jgi:hypothetical protein
MAGKVKKGTFGFQTFTTKDIRRALRENNPEYQLLGEYTGYKDLHRFQHSCGNVIESIAGPIARGFGKTCPCTHKRVNYRTLEIRQQEIKELAGADYECVVFVKGKDKSTYRHITCGYTWKAEFVAFQNRKQRACPKCYGRFNGNLSIDEVKTRLIDTPYKLVTYGISRKGCQIQHEFEHTCGTRFKHQLNDLLACKVTGCPSCKHRLYAKKDVTVDGHGFQVRGAEDKALQFMVSTMKVKPRFVVNQREDGLPTFEYQYANKRHRYIPDFYVSNRNLVVEVKCFGTLGLMPRRYKFFNYSTLTRARAKAKSVLSNGYNFLLLLQYKDRMVPIPNDWLSWNKQALRSYLKTV